MASLGRALARAIHGIERRVDGWRELRAGREPFARADVRIEAYRGFGVPERAYVAGRVLRGAPFAPAADGEHVLRRFATMLRRFESDEVPHARVIVRHPGGTTEAAADEEGHFATWVRPRPSFADGTFWHPLEVELASPRSDPAPRTTAEVLVPPRESAFGVISDLDDTVIATGATSAWRMARTVLFSNARTRAPFAGVAAFYRALHRGPDGTPPRPLFYVSGSPWNLHDLLSELFALRDIPAGPMLLRDWGLGDPRGPRGGRVEHKLAAIRTLLDLYERLPFVLIGDSGQDDPEIYARIVAEHPGRVLAVYIREVELDRAGARRLADVAAEVARGGSTLVAAGDTIAVADHAAAHGWIPEAALPGIAAEVGAAPSR